MMRRANMLFGLCLAFVSTPAVSADCDLWNTQEFFETATLEAVSNCLAKYEDPNARNHKSNTPLILATKFNDDSDVVRALLVAGADPNARGEYHYSPLELAAIWNENPAVVEALVAAGADPNARDRGNSTPLHLAAGYNTNSAVIHALIAAGRTRMPVANSTVQIGRAHV